MSVFKKLFGKKVDERQELELLKVEHNVYWLTWGLLLIAIMVQFVMGVPFEQMLPEWIIFMISCIAVCVGCVCKGLWSFQSKKVPGIKSYLLYSLFMGFIGVAFGVFTVVKWEIKEISTIITVIGFYAVMLFGTGFVLFLIVGGLAKSREKKLEQQALKEDDDDSN